MRRTVPYIFILLLCVIFTQKLALASMVDRGNLSKKPSIQEMLDAGGTFLSPHYIRNRRTADLSGPWCRTFPNLDLLSSIMKQQCESYIAATTLPSCIILPPWSKTLGDEQLTLQQLLNKEKEGLTFDNANKKGILVLGNSGSGKTTLTQLIAGDTDKLHSVKTQANKTVIIDDDQKIGLPSTQSKTLVPNVFIDPETATTFYDCPGFDDNRGPVKDMVSNIYIKKILDHIDEMQLLFLVSYSSIKTGNDRLDFAKLVKHASTMVKSWDKVEDGFALIVTKVGSYSNEGNYLSDNEILGEIQHFLETFSATQNARISSDGFSISQNEKISHEIKFTEILLKSKNYWFNRSPDRCGKISSIPASMESRTNIKKLIANMNFVSTKPTDFGYSVKAETALQIRNWVAESNSEISNNMQTLVENLKLQHSRRIKAEGAGVEHLLKELEKHMKTFTNLTNICKAEKNLKQFATNVQNSLNSINLKTNKLFIDNMTHHGELLEFFDLLTNQTYPRSSQAWIRPIEIFKDTDISNRKDWNEFLKYVHDRLDHWNFHHNKPAPTSVPIDINSISTYLTDKLDVSINSNNRELFNSFATLKDKENLKFIIQFALESPKFECSSNTLTILGKYVRVSDFIDESNKTLNCRDVKSIHVLATKNFFVDRDLNATGMVVEIVIISPKWNIIDRRIFDLSGNPGINQPKEATVLSKGMNGKAGKPGGKGGNAGSFFGIGESIRNVANLEISLNGGDGGKGGDGGDGMEGEKGADFLYKDFPLCYGSVNHTLDSEVDSIIFTFVYNHAYIKIYGNIGNKGGDGGHGGAGGLGGNPGFLSLFNFYSGASPRISSFPGKTGESGVCGVGGPGGKPGVGTSCRRWLNFPIIAICGWADCKSIHRNSSGIGEKGSSCKSDNNLQSANSIESVINKLPSKVPVTPFRAIIKFKKYFLGNFDHLFPNLSFIKSLDTHPENFCNAECLGIELLEIEKLFTADLNALSHFNYYQDFVQRVENFAITMKSSLSKEDKKLLAMLYTTALSKLVGLKQDNGITMIIKILDYFQTFNEALDKLSAAEIKVAVQEEGKRYTAEFEKKVQETLAYIDKTLLPAMEIIEIEIEGKTDALRNQTHSWINGLESELRDAKKTEANFQSTMGLRTLFSVVKGISQVATLLGPLSTAVGGIVGSSANMVENFVLGDENIKGRSQIKLPTSVTRDYALSIDTKIKQNEAKILKKTEKLIESSKTALAGNEAQLNTLRPLATEVENELKNWKSSKNHMPACNYDIGLASLERKSEKLTEKMIQTQAELEKQMKEVTDLEGKLDKTKSTTKKCLDALATANIVIRAADVGIDITNKILNDKAKLTELGYLVKESEEKLAKAKKYRESINDVLVPLTESLSSNVMSLYSNLAQGNNSISSLQMSKWKIKSKLKEFKIILRSFTAGQPLQEEFIHVVEKMDDALNLLIDLYDTIEKYEEKNKFANHISNINSLSALSIDFTDQGKRNLVDRLNVATRSNLFLAEYNKAIHAFKQWVFPFAHYYLQDFKLPKIIHGENFADIMQIYKSRVETIKNCLEKYKTQTIENHDTHLFTANFTSNLISTKPFYVWRNEKWTKSISQILSGKKVLMKANVRDAGMEGKLAIKFKKIELNFKSKVESKQVDIDRALNSLKLEMTHSGISEYKFGSNYYSMFGDRQKISYHFERDENGERVGRNGIYNKFKDGDYLFSPYAMWTIQLFPVHGHHSSQYFNELIRLAPFVDLELVGLGTYVDENSFNGGIAEDLNLEDYYEISDEDSASLIQDVFDTSIPASTTV